MSEVFSEPWERVLDELRYRDRDDEHAEADWQTTTQYYIHSCAHLYTLVPPSLSRIRTSHL